MGEHIVVKSMETIEKMAESSRIVAETLQLLRDMVKPGISTLELDRAAYEYILKKGGKPSFLGYHGFPGTICASINEEVVHGIPSADRILKDGDIVSIDIGVYKNGYHGDAAITVPAGKVNLAVKRLLEVTEEALECGIAQAVAGNKLYDISAAVQRHAEEHGYSIVRDYVGHGIGKIVHEPPMIPNFGKAGTGPEIKAGHVFAIEPMVNMGRYQVKTLKDKWTVVTSDGKLSAHFEHTVAILEKGNRILTKLS